MLFRISQEGIRGYQGEHVTLTLPDGKTLDDIAWFSIWCEEFGVNFGDIRIPRNLDHPKPKKIGALPTLEHSVSSDRIVVVDAQTFLIPNFRYDGTAPGKPPTSSGPRQTLEDPLCLHS